MQWLRLYHDTPNDPKWRVVAVRSGQPVGNVLAVWMQMLVCASEAEERGILEGWDDETVAAVLGYPPAVVTVIRACMQGLVLDGDRLTGWDNRQRASDDAGGRQRKTRERRETKPPGGGGHGGNGHDPDHSATVARQTDNVARQTDNVATNPLRAQTPDLQKEEEGGGTGAHEIAVLVGGLTGLTATKANVATVEEWLAKGYDPQQDVYPAVVKALPTAKTAPGTFAYFTQPIGRHHAARTAPPSNIAYLPRAAGGRQAPSDAMSRGAQDLMAALSNPNFDYGMRR